jgi:hypothetical protein
MSKKSIIVYNSCLNFYVWKYNQIIFLKLVTETTVRIGFWSIFLSECESTGILNICSMFWNMSYFFTWMPWNLATHAFYCSSGKRRTFAPTIFMAVPGTLLCPSTLTTLNLVIITHFGFPFRWRKCLYSFQAHFCSRFVTLDWKPQR